MCVTVDLVPSKIVTHVTSLVWNENTSFRVFNSETVILEM